jgi:replicative DNA helicase
VTILNSQLSRAAIGAEVNLSQLKGSGAIEEFADVVMALATLSRTEYPRPIDLHILKSRYSEIGKIRLDFYSSVGRFEEHHED